TRFSPVEFMFVIRFSSRSSMNGPFFVLLGISTSYPFSLRFLRRRRIKRELAFLRLRVLRPSGSPHGLHAGRPPLDLPSPPPSGGSTGFRATPRTRGRLRSQRVRPALPDTTFSWSRLPTWPMLA